MGRKGPPGLPFFLTLLVLVLTQSCRKSVLDPVNPESRFSAAGQENGRILGVYSGDDRVGDMRVAVRKGQWGDGKAATELMQSVLLRISFRSERFILRSEQTAWIDEDLNLLGSAETMDFGAGKWETRAVLKDEGSYEVVRSYFGGDRRETVTVPGGILASEVLPLYLHRYRGEQGKGTELTVFNMSLGQEIPVTFVDEGVTDRGRLFTVTYWGMEERLWLDDDGLAVREEMSLGVQADSPRGQGEETDAYLSLESVLARSAVPAVDIPDNLKDRTEIRIVLEGSFKKPPSGTWQKVQMNGERALVTLSRPTPPGPGERRVDTGVMPPDEFELDLDSTRIRDLALKLTDGLEDPWEKALAVGDWVHGNIKQSMKECFSALQVLQTGEGECQSHSLLMVALCRAAGIPARFVYGVVHMPAESAYFFHTWVEVYVGEWIPIDPTLGDFPAGVDHLTLAVGAYRDQFSIFPFIMTEGGWRISMADSR